MRRIIPVLLLSLALLSGGCIRNSPISELFAPSEEKIAAAPTATVADFAETYAENAAKADSDYRGKWVKIRGKIESVRKHKGMQGTNQTDYFYVALKDDTGKTKEIITCRFNFNKTSDLHTLKKGQTATFYGIIDDLDSVTSMPVITDCQIVK